MPFERKQFLFPSFWRSYSDQNASHPDWCDWVGRFRRTGAYPLLACWVGIPLIHLESQTGAYGREQAKCDRD